MKNFFNLSNFKKSESVTGNKSVKTPFQFRLSIILSVLLMLFSVSAWGETATPYTVNASNGALSGWSGTVGSKYSDGSVKFSTQGNNLTNASIWSGEVSSGMTSISVTINYKVNGTASNNNVFTVYAVNSSSVTKASATFAPTETTKTNASVSLTIPANSNVTGLKIEYTNKASGNVGVYSVSATATYTPSGGDPTLSSISVKTAPTKTSYTEGEYFDPTGLVITRTYSDASTSDWTYASHTSDFTFTPSTSTALTTSNTSVTITYGGKSTTQAITVTSGGGGGGGGSCSVFSETWDGCDGTGGNDDKWSGSGVAGSTPVISDNSGWTYSTCYKGDQCTRTNKAGYAQTPSISVTSGTTYTLSYKAADWGNDGCTFTISATGATITAGSSSGTLSQGSWGEHSATLTATASTMQIKFQASSGARGWLDEVCIDVAGPSYTVTATVDDAAHGSVSVSGNTITVTPNAGWVPNGYTVTSGTATAVQSGNIFTVTPSSDCTVQINFRAASTYTVTIIDNGTSYNETATEGVPYELPDEGLSTCPDANLLGWATGTYTNHDTGTSTEPTYDAPGTSKNITGNTTFTAVYGVLSDAVSNQYGLISTASELVTGDYLVVAHYSGNSSKYAMKNTVNSSSYMNEQSVTITDNKITSTDASLIWHITKTGANYTIYNEAVSKYLALTSSSPALQTESHNFSAAVTSTNVVFESSTVTGYQLVYDYNFKSSTTQTDPIRLYKRLPVIGLWTSKPFCCHAPSTELEINSETSTFIGSGVATISLIGGNGKPITWSCKDEANVDRSSYLSGTSGTGATLTLPTNAATKVYTVTATQGDDETDPDNVICGATVTLNFTVKAQFTINFKTVDGGSESLYSSITVTDGDTYTMPSLAEDFDCGTSGKSFMGWASSNSATSIEKTAGTDVTATAAATWYACWATSADVQLVPLYKKVTSTDGLAAGDKVLICNTAGTVAIGAQNTNNRAAVAVSAQGEDSVYFTGTSVRELTVGKSGDYYTFYDAVQGGYLYAAGSGSSNHLKTQSTNNANGEWTLDITSSGEATVTAHGDKTNNKMRKNTSSALFSCYSSGQQPVVFYKKTDKTKSVTTGSGSITTNMDGCTSGPTIRANTNQWITSAAGQKVKTVIDVTAMNFEEAATLIATSSNGKFEILLAATAVPTKPGSLATTLTVEYTPTESDVTESSTITLQAGEITKTITVFGRSLPEEFLLITKKTVWYALPANMNDGPGEYEGVVVTPDDGTSPTMVGIAPSTVLYSLQAVTSDRYEDHGDRVRLVGNNSFCLWSNRAGSAPSFTHIQNKTNVATATDINFEWLLTTTDGVQYTIANPEHPNYATGRRLAYGTKFGMYIEPTIFYIVPAGCSSQPGEVAVGPRRVDATFSWVSNTTDMHIDLYTNEEMTEGHMSKTASSSPFVFTGLTESTDYWYQLTPGTDVACAVTGTFKTTGPIIDIVEWQENGVVLFIDKGDINPLIVIDGQEEHGSITGGGSATELFFAKYFEGAGTMKLLSIFNGTKEAISLADYSIFIRCRNKSDGWSPSSDATLNLSSLGSINAGQEIIFFTRPDGGDLSDCSDDFLNDKVDNSSDATSNPRWIECDGTPFKKIEFNGNDPIMLKKSGTIIDIIGSQGAAATTYNCLPGNTSEKGWAGTVRNMDYDKSPSDPAFDAFYAASSISPVTRQDSIDLLEAFGINLANEEISLTTARCIFFRDKRVTSGDSAVLMNGSTFVTFTNHDAFKSEWYGRSVCMDAAAKTAAGVASDARPTCNSYQDIANMDYNKYYIDWNNLFPGQELSDFTPDPETKEYTIPIADMRQYACLKLRFQLKLGEEVLTEAAEQVPIVVAANADTNDPLFSELVEDKDTHEKLYPQSKERCSTCNVVILNNVTLTKGSNSDPKDVPEIGNLKIYPGGKLIVPEETEYTVQSIAFRRQEDAVSSANIQGTLNIGKTNGVYFDMRVDPSYWHFFSLPYDCNVSDIRYANEEETAVPVLGTDFMIKWYDGQKRAATQDGGCWAMVAADATLKKGLGYIYALPGDGKVRRELRFPMSNDVITEDLGAKTIGQVYGYGCDKTDEEIRPNHKGWNLIGDPYLMPYKTDFDNPLRTGLLVHTPDPWDGTWMIEENPSTQNVHYIVERIDNGWSGYKQVSVYEHAMSPFTCYFVQIGGSNPEAGQDINFTAAGASALRSVVRRAPAEYSDVEDTHPVWCAVDITNTLGETDETTLVISNDFTDNYDMMNDLVKLRGTYYSHYSRPVIASRNNEGEMAFNALPDASAAAGVPLNYFAASSGEYTISYNDKFGREEVKAVMLHDKQTGTWHDLMEDSYTFASNRVDNTDRFVLIVRVERKKTPENLTDIENLYNGTEEGPRKLLINGHVYIMRGGQLFDITGKQVKH